MGKDENNTSSGKENLIKQESEDKLAQTIKEPQRSTCLATKIRNTAGESRRRRVDVLIKSDSKDKLG